MFYAHFVLSKKGPLARIWLAAHWDKKLTKAHVFETNIEGSVEAIIQPKVKLALRTSGHLLLGVVRIYSRKAKYLLADCNEAFVKIKMAFRPGVVDLPEENREAAMSAITLPEAFHEFDTTMADLSDLDVQAHFTGNQSRPEEITMREDLGNITLVGDDGFGDMGFEGDMMEDDHMDDSLYVKPGDPSALLLEGASEKDQDDQPMDIDFESQQREEDAFASPMNDDYEGPAGADDDDDSDRDDFGGGVDHEDIFGEKFVGEGGGLFEDPMAEPAVPSDASDLLQQQQQNKPGVDPFVQPVATPAPEAASNRPSYMNLGLEGMMGHLPQEQTPVVDNMTLVQNDTEAFALKPIDITTIGTERKVKKKRKLVIDEQKAIASETMKLQLSDTTDIVTTLDLAPPTKKLMHWKETGGVEKLFAFPGRALVSKKLSQLFTMNLITKSASETSEATRTELELEHARTEESEPHDQLSAAGDMPELPLATQDAYRPPTMEAPSIVEESSLFNNQSLQQPSVVAADASTSEEPMPQPSQSPPTSPAPSLPPLPPQPGGGNSDDDDDDDNDGGFYNEDASTEPEEEEDDVPLEQMEGEAEEEAEERRWNKRSQQMLHSLSRVLARHDSVGFKDLITHGNRKHVASKFYTLLVLKKSQAVDVEQTEPYGDILISRGAAFTAIC